ARDVEVRRNARVEPHPREFGHAWPPGGDEPRRRRRPRRGVEDRRLRVDEHERLVDRPESRPDGAELLLPGDDLLGHGERPAAWHRLAWCARGCYLRQRRRRQHKGGKGDERRRATSPTDLTPYGTR